jgi:hypothetical protein
LGEFGLTVVEGPEFLRVQFQGAGDVQGVEGTYAEGWCMTAGKVCASLPGGVRELYDGPKARVAVAVKLCGHSLCLDQGESLEKYLLMNGIREFSAIERTD